MKLSLRAQWGKTQYRIRGCRFGGKISLEGQNATSLAFAGWWQARNDIIRHPEPVTDDDEFSECQNSMFIFQIPRLVRNWNFEQNNQTFPKKQTMVLFSLAFLLCLLLEWTESTFDFPPYFFPLFFCRKVKISEVCKNCSTKPLSKQQNNFWKILSGKEEARTRRH